MRSTRLLAGSLAALVLAALVFVTWPQLDLWAARVFFAGDNQFVGDTPLGRFARTVLEVTPFLLGAGLLLRYGLRRSGILGGWAPNGAAVIMMAASLAIGPGLLVNEVLKNHSHRPRPIQTAEFGGADPFRPFYRFDGACERNCSFVSGEGASASWTLAPALLVPAPFGEVAIGLALVFGAAAGGLRMAFGGHYLSDTVFAALFTWLIIIACWRGVATLGGTPPGAYRD